MLAFFLFWLLMVLAVYVGASLALLTLMPKYLTGLLEDSSLAEKGEGGSR